MKASAFDLERPASLAEAIALLSQTGPEARALAGGQSLGPMLNFRVVQPRLLVQVSHLPELAGVAEDEAAITIGACVTHAAIADGRAPGIGRNVLARVAAEIAYRAVRNRGTIGGSLCHADPAADWVTVLTALGAEALLQSAAGARRVPVAAFVTGAFTTALAAGEILIAVRIPRLPRGAGWGYVKACRKPGEFAHAMAACVVGPETRRLAIGALGSKPILLHGAQASVQGARDALADVPGIDAVAQRMQLGVVRRALDEARACAA